MRKIGVVPPGQLLDGEGNPSTNVADIEDGWIIISDPATQAQLLRFFVGFSQTKLQLVAPS